MIGNDDFATSDHVRRLERQANAVRARLVRTIDALDARRHQVSEIGRYAKSLAVPALVTVAAVASLAIGIAFVVRKRRSHSLEYRAKALVSRFRAPERPSFAREVTKKLTLAVLTFAATEAARRAAKNVFDGRYPRGRLALPASDQTRPGYADSNRLPTTSPEPAR